MFLCKLLYRFNVHESLVVARNCNNFHTANCGSSWVGSVGRGGNKANVSSTLTNGLLVLANGHKTCILALSSTLGLT